MATESQLRANKKWQAGKICSLACRVKVTDAEKFKRYCAARGQTPNAVLTAYIQECGRAFDDSAPGGSAAAGDGDTTI